MMDDRLLNVRFFCAFFSSSYRISLWNSSKYRNQWRLVWLIAIEALQILCCLRDWLILSSDKLASYHVACSKEVQQDYSCAAESKEEWSRGVVFFREKPSGEEDSWRFLVRCPAALYVLVDQFMFYPFKCMYDSYKHFRLSVFQEW